MSADVIVVPAALRPSQATTIAARAWTDAATAGDPTAPLGPAQVFVTAPNVEVVMSSFRVGSCLALVTTVLDTTKLDLCEAAFAALDQSGGAS